MLTIKYDDHTKWPSLIKLAMPLAQFQRRYGIKGQGRIEEMARSKTLMLATVVLMSTAIEEVIAEKEAEIRANAQQALAKAQQTLDVIS